VNDIISLVKKDGKMILRRMLPTFEAAMSEYAVVVVYGPRQSGKTTLSQIGCKNFNYANLEDKETRELAQNDYKAFFRRFPAPLIIDEVQRLPELLAQVQVIVDGNGKEPGQFVLTGSQQTELAAAVDESLAGRCCVLDLMPLSLAEVQAAAATLSTDEILVRGLMPELWVTNKNPTLYYRNYFRTYVERDVRRILNVKDLVLFERFVTLLAGRVGQLVNFSSLAGEVGVSSTTISSWMSVLESSFLIYRLQPYHTNIAKRLVKSPKVYFTEPGLAAYLMGIETPEQMSTHPLRGNLFENLAVMEAYKRKSDVARDPRLFFYRTEKGFEVDLIQLEGNWVIPTEIKSAMTYSKSLISNLDEYCRQEKLASNPQLVYDGEMLSGLGASGVTASNIRECCNLDLVQEVGK